MLVLLSKLGIVLLLASFCQAHADIPFHKLSDLSPAFEALLNETVVTPLPPGIKYNPEISYLFADIKYRPGALKICEFGEARNAAGNKSEVIFGNVPIQINSPYWLLFWNYLAQFKLPVWYVGINPVTHYNENHVMQIHEKVEWSAFTRMGGYFAEELSDLEQDHMFKYYAQSNPTMNPGSLGKCKGIIVYRHRDDRYPARAALVESFKQDNPDFLFLDEASAPYAASKQALAELLNTKKLRQLKPHWRIYKKQYTETLASQILYDLGTQNVVIKPVNSGRSNGVMMVQKERLDSVLKKILIKDPLMTDQPLENINTSNIRPKNPKTFGYWQRDRNDVFMVESLEESKPLFVCNKWYDPTMRIIFVLACDGKKMHTTILGGYWEIPIAGLSDDAKLTEKHCSIAMHEPGYVGLRIEKNDLLDIKKILNRFLPKIYKRMLDTARDKALRAG